MEKLQREHKRIQDRIDAMYMDKLDGRIDGEFFDRKAGEFRAEQGRLLRDINNCREANRAYFDEGIKLLALAQKAHQLFENQPAIEKRRLLDFMLSNCRWKSGQLEADYRQPFDLLAVTAAEDGKLRSSAHPPNGEFVIWQGMMYSTSTLTKCAGGPTEARDGVADRQCQWAFGDYVGEVDILLSNHAGIAPFKFTIDSDTALQQIPQ